MSGFCVSFFVLIFFVLIFCHWHMAEQLSSLIENHKILEKKAKIIELHNLKKTIWKCCAIRVLFLFLDPLFVFKMTTENKHWLFFKQKVSKVT